jgi:cyclophilin family peptidyl-prolyl cis-trans isomerase
MVRRGAVGGALAGLAACSGPGNFAPEITYIEDQTSVAGRSIPTLKTIGTDRDNNLLTFEAVQLPKGLTISKHTGWISGTPEVAPGPYEVIIRATDRAGASTERRFTWIVRSQRFTHRREGEEIVFTAENTDDAGTDAYCINTDNVRPKEDDPCWKKSNEGGLTARYAIPEDRIVMRHFLWTRDTSGRVGDTKIGAPYGEALYNAARKSVRPVVALTTTFGEFAIELQDTFAPTSTQNFLKYVHQGFYDGTVFHRVIKEFMVQTGGYTWSADGGYQQKAQGLPPIPLERTSVTTLTHSKWTVGMARTSVPDSATTEFFINTVDNYFLDYSVDAEGTVNDGYAVFGEVIFGAETTLEQLRSVTVGPNPFTQEESEPVGDPPRIIDALRIN